MVVYQNGEVTVRRSHHVRHSGLLLLAAFVIAGPNVRSAPAQQFAPRAPSPSTAGPANGAIRDMRVVADRAVGDTQTPTSLTSAQLIHLAKLAEQNGSLEDAGHLYREALASFPKERLVLLNVARWQHRSGELDSAIVTYEECIKQFPNDAVALNDLGLCCSRAGDLPSAVQHVTAAANQRPGSKRYRNNLAILLVEANQLDQAVAVLNEVHGPAVGQYNAACLLEQRGRGQEATGYLQQAISLDPTLVSAQQLLLKVQRQVAEAAVPGIVPLEATPTELPAQQASLPTLTAPQNAGLASATSNEVQPPLHLVAPPEQAPEIEQYPIPNLR